MNIDLHCHSHFSDGLHSPATLVDKAIAAQLDLLALTDHDTVDGLAQLQQSAGGKPITVINGIELSTRWKKYDIHIIGLHIDVDCAQLRLLIAQQNSSRVARAMVIAERLALFGVQDAYAKACAIAGHKRVGRPHFAQVLINEGKTRDMRAAFAQYLARGRPAYEATPWVAMADAVAIINAAGGFAVIAHPLKYDLTRTRLQELIKEFKLAGGLGMEVVAGEMTITQVEDMAGICNRYELLASAGSDFHGEGISRVAIGRGAKLPVNCKPVWQQWCRD